MSEAVGRQPKLGLAGLVLVLVVAIPLAIGADGPQESVVVLGPLVASGLPVIAMIAFWWEDWPGSRLHAPLSGVTDTVVIVVAAVLVAALGRLAVGRSELAGLAGAAFVVMLQLTLVSDGWPLHPLGWFAGGVVAVVFSWAVAYGLWSLDVPGGLLILVGLWQVWFYVAWQGWPFAGLQPQWLQLLAANVAVIGGACLTYAVLHAAAVDEGTIFAAAGSAIAAALVLGMLFEGWVSSRLAMTVGVALLATALYGILRAYADGLDWTDASPQEWVGHVGLNAIGVGVILHVAIGRRWPFTET